MLLLFLVVVVDEHDHLGLSLNMQFSKVGCIFRDNPIMMMMIIMNRNCQGLDTALKCCYEDIEDTLTVPPEVRKHQISKT